ncbi:neural cell adhesion molecule 1-like [Pelodytes ibericus]
MLSMYKMGPQTFSVLTLTLLIATVSCSKKTVNIIPSNGDVYIGETKYFMCKANAEAKLQWQSSDDEDLEYDNGRYKLIEVDETMIGLNVTIPKIEDDHVIKCKAEFESEENIEAEITLTVIQRPKILGDSEKSKEFTAGSVAKFPCVVEGIPPPKISWTYNGRALSSSQDRVSIGLEGTLQIDSIQLSDAGQYSCKASIEKRGEMNERAVSVIVNAAPVIRLPIVHPNGTSKSNASLACSVTGNPQPKITWKRGMEPILDDGQKYILSSNGQELSILDLDMSDEGEYNCHAANNLGEESATLFLQVIDEPKRLGAGVIAGILLILLLAVLLAVDMTCYRTRQRGFLMYISTNLLGKTIPRVKLEENDVKKASADKSQVINISGIDA